MNAARLKTLDYLPADESLIVKSDEGKFYQITKKIDYDPWNPREDNDGNLGTIVT